MKQTIMSLLLICLLGVTGISCSSTSTKTASVACDRDCLRALVDQYLEAVVADHPSGLPLADDVRYTEDTAEIPVGDGLWVGASEAPAGFRIYALDPESGQAGFMGAMKEWDETVILSLRLKVENGEITEIEHVLARDPYEDGLDNLVTPRPAFVTPVPPELRNTREEMFEIANLYFDAIEQDSGDIAPFADDCVRHENGRQITSNPPPDPTDYGDSPEEQEELALAKVFACNCREQTNTGIHTYITRIRPRRLVVIDEELGLVYGFPTFVHRGDIRTMKIKNVPGVDEVTLPYGSINLQAGEIFKIFDDQIHEVEAIGFVLPYGLESGWEGD